MMLYLIMQLRRIERVLLWTIAACAAFLQDVKPPKARPRLSRITRIERS